MEKMAATKRASERRDEHLGIRLTKPEAKRLRDVGKAYPTVAKSDLVRHALMKGLDLIAVEGITISPAKART